MAKHSDRTNQVRQQLAMTAARIMVEDGQGDFQLAKRKAAERLGVNAKQLLPSNQEIEAELRAYQALFKAADQPDQLRQLRQAALEAMRFFARFQPLLTGPVLEGTADSHSLVTLHLYAHTPEELSLFLLENQIPYEQGEMGLRMNGSERQPFPVFRFIAGEARMELVLFSLEGGRQPPRSPVDGRPMQRANLRQLENLLAEPAQSSPGGLG